MLFKNRFSPAQENFVKKFYLEGEQTGAKYTALQIAEKMETSVNESGELLFPDSSDWLKVHMI